MHFSTAVLATASAALAQAATISVAVGNGSLIFSPSDIKAQMGDTVEFSFFPKNHSVVQSSFADPCHPLAGGQGFFSTFVPTTTLSNKTFSLLINDTKPIWLYCSQTTGNHCQQGMFAAINAPDTGNTLAAFALKAKNATISTSPPDSAPVGGILAVKGAGSRTVTTSVTTTVTKEVTVGASSYATTYATTYGTTYTTDVVEPTTSASSGSGSGSTAGSGSGSSSTTSSTAPKSTGAANGLTVNGGMAGAVLLAGLAML